METLLTLTLAGSSLALLLLALRYVLLRKMPSTVYYYAWLLVLLRFVLPLPGLIPAGGGQPASLPAETALPYVQEEIAPLPVFPAAGVVPAAKAEKTAAAEAEEHGPDLSVQTEMPTLRKTSFNWRTPRLWLGLWAAGSCLCLAVPVISYIRFTGHLRRSLRRPEAFVCSVYDGLPGRQPVLYTASGLSTPLM